MVTALQSNDQNAMHERPTTPAGPGPKESSDGRFTYASGSRPLEGYTIKRGIGHGGFGEVYYATSDAGKEVALKLIRRNLDVELRGIKQCLNLKHPNLLTVYDIREDNQGDHWVVMEYVAGECLEDAVASHPKGLPVEEVLAWFQGIALGVGYLHDHGIVHRDLKPGNLFSDEGRVEIGDYGLSKFVSCSRRSGQTESVGTVHYMAPEVANGRYGKEIDIYALGIILHEMLTGRVPFEGESVGEVLMKHLTAEPDVSMLAEPYRSVVAKALRKDPAKRFRSVGEMAAQLPGLATTTPSGVLSPGRSGPAGTAHTGPEATPGPGAAVVAEAVDDEPVLRAGRQFWSELRTTWDASNLNAPAKLILLLVGAAVVLMNAEVLVPLAILLLFLYGGYRVVRAIVLSIGGRHEKQVAQPAAAPAQPPPQAGAAPQATPAGHRTARRAVPRWARAREKAAAALVIKSPGERITELLGSMVGGALVAITMCLVVVIINSFRSELPRPEQCAWLGLVSILGTWAVLVPSKFWEGTQGEAILRRFVMMVIGLGLGVVAYLSADLLMVHLSYDPKFLSPPLEDGVLPAYQMPSSFYGSGGSPQLLAYMATFGTLFFVIRWWRQADPLRATRLRLGAVLGCLILAGLIAALWHFPQPWLIMVACVMSVSIQLAGPWLHPRRRQPRHQV